MLKFLQEDIHALDNGDTLIEEIIHLHQMSDLRCQIRGSLKAFKKLQNVLMQLQSPENTQNIIIEHLLRNVTNLLNEELKTD